LPHTFDFDDLLYSLFDWCPKPQIRQNLRLFIYICFANLKLKIVFNKSYFKDLSSYCQTSKQYIFNAEKHAKSLVRKSRFFCSNVIDWDWSASILLARASRGFARTERERLDYNPT
jgi:hypothetical protein